MSEATKAERAYRAFSMSSVGLEMGVCVFVGWAIGHFAVDQQFDTAPYGTLVFLGIGVAAGFKALFRVARQAKQLSGESNE
jgi:ATP synthase protein I